MNKTNLAILDPVAYAEHIAKKHREATEELKELAAQQPNTQTLQRLRTKAIETPLKTITPLKPSLEIDEATFSQGELAPFPTISWPSLLLGIGLGAGLTAVAMAFLGGSI